MGSKSTSRIWTGSTGGVDFVPPSLDDLCLAFFSFLLLGRFPKSTPFDIIFLFSPTDGRGWDSPYPTTLSITFLPLFSFMVAIPKRKTILVKNT